MRNKTKSLIKSQGHHQFKGPLTIYGGKAIQKRDLTFLVRHVHILLMDNLHSYTTNLRDLPCMAVVDL